MSNPSRSVAVCAHRGGAGLAPENTMAAFERAVGLGVDWIELDVQTCATGELVVIHEPDLRRLAGLPDEVAKLSLSELQSVDVGSHFGAGFSSERVPTLAGVLETFDGRVRFNVEVKEYGIAGDGTARATASLLASRGMGDRVVVSSYNVFSLSRVRRAARGLPIGLVHPPVGGVPGPRRSLRDALLSKPRAARWLKPRVLLPAHERVTRLSVEAAHARGMEVHAWPVNEAERMRQLVALGVDVIITDRPDIAIEIRDS